jgi:1-deoxyxylulose-5-phosphate synthase
MKYRYLGNSGLAVSTICLGTATFGQKGWGCDKTVSHNILDEYFELGGNFIDTADKYGDTNSERYIGEWLNTKNRDDLVIASKCFFPLSENINDKGLSRKHILSACENSLRRLKTDYIDLYQIHNQDPQTPLIETLDALNTLIDHGKVRYVGLSNFPAWKIIKMYHLSDKHNFRKFISGQFLYNLLKRNIEQEIIPACEDVGMSVLCWSPLSGGILTGKYDSPTKLPKDTRIGQRTELTKDKYQSWYNNSIDTVKLLKKIAKDFNKSTSTVALSWLLKNPNVGSLIVGAKNKNQISENCAASDWDIPTETWKLLEEKSKIKFDYPFDVFSTTTEGWFEKIG